MEEKNKIKSGTWYILFDEQGNCTEVVYDKSFRELLGFDNTDEYINSVSSWFDIVHPDDREKVSKFYEQIEKESLIEEHYDVEYRMKTKNGFRWFHDFARVSRRDDGTPCRCDGVVFDIQEQKDISIMHEHDLMHAKLQDYLINNEGDPIEVLKTFAEPIRALLDCDQIVYRDLYETRIMVNSERIADAWSVPEDYCKQCQHFDAHHPMYKNGYTEMNNCQEGWKGIPVYEKCPIKSSLTRIVYCDGEVAGYFAIHYVKNYHEFTDVERKTALEFSKTLSLCLSRYKAKKEAEELRKGTELDNVKRSLKMMFSLSKFDPIIIIDPETGSYEWMMSMASDVDANTSMNIKGDDVYKNIGIDASSIIHPEDRAQYIAFYTKENMLRIANTGISQEIENRWFIQTENRYRYKYNKAVKMVDDNGKVFIAVGVIDTTEEKENQARILSGKKYIEGYTKKYDSTFLANLDTGKYEVISNKDQTIVPYLKNKRFGDLLRDIVNNCVMLQDKANFPEATFDGKKAKEFYQIDKSFNIEYRRMDANDTGWYRASFQRINESEVLIGFRSCDNEIVNSILSEKLLNDYDAVYGVDLDRGLILPAVTSKVSNVGNFNGIVKYKELVLKFAETVDEKYKQDWIKFSDCTYMKKYMAEEDHREYIYELPDAPLKMRRFSVDVIQRSNGEANIALFSFMGIDEKRTEMILNNRNAAQRKKLLDYFINTFNSAYLVNLEDNTFEILHMDNEQEKHFGEFGNTRKSMINYIEKYVHPDDKQQMYRNIDKEYIASRLKENSSYSFVMRIVDGEQIKSIRGLIVKVEDEYHVAVGFIDISKEIEKEANINKQLSQSLTFTNFFLEPYISAYFVNFDTLEYKVFKRGKRLNQYLEIKNYYESLRKYLEEVVYPEDQPELLELIKPENMKEILKNQPEYYHIYRENFNGEKREVRMQLFRGTDENTAALGFIDVTDELKNQRERFLGAVPLSPDVLGKANIGLWSFELDNGKAPRMYVDDTMLRLLGLDHQLSPEETYHAWYDNIDNGSYDLVKEAVDKMSSGELAEVQYPWHSPNGKTIIVRCGGVRNFDYKDGIRVEGVHQNVTEVVRYDEELRRREQEDLTLMLISSLSDTYATLYYIDPDTGSYQLLSKNEEYASEINNRLVHGNNFYADTKASVQNVIYREDWSKIVPYYSKDNMEASFGNNDSFSFDYRLIIQGKLVWYRTKAVKFNENGKIRYAIGVMNIEEEVEKKKILEDALERAERASSAKTEFLFNMSHDIRTPMNAIVGYTNMAIKHNNDSIKVNDSLGKIKAASEHLLSLINDILEMSRIEAGKLKINNGPLDIRDAIKTVTNMSQALAITKDINFRTIIGDIKNPYIYADELHINQVIINLVSNGIKYTENGGKVEYYAEQLSDPVDGVAVYRFIIKDNGIGMSEDFQTHLFETFSREEREMVNNIEGTGLGLSIVKKILDLVGGRVNVDSKQDVGSTFTVYLPFKVMTQDEQKEFIESKEKLEEVVENTRLNDKKVLLVEDNALNRELALEILKDIGLQADTATDGSAAVRILKEKGPAFYDAILMDIQMPIMNGYEATRKIRGMYPDAGIPIIALSANAFAEDRKASLDAGMDDHISKPININELLKALTKFLLQ